MLEMYCHERGANDAWSETAWDGSMDYYALLLGVEEQPFVCLRTRPNTRQSEI